MTEDIRTVSEADARARALLAEGEEYHAVVMPLTAEEAAGPIPLGSPEVKWTFVDPPNRRVEILEAALAEALEGWASADGAADSQFRISTDPPCEDEARIAELRKLLTERSSS